MKTLKDSDPTEYLSTSRQIAEFIDNVVWKDIEKELKEWLNQILDDLVENAEGNDIHLHRGRAQALRKVLLLPQIMFESIQMEEDTERDSKKE